MSLFAELKRRNVFRVGIAYLITAWLLLQVADVMIDNIGAPEWLFQAILLVLGIGFVIAVIFAWAFELTPDGIRRDSEVDHSDPAVAQTSQKLNRAIIVMLVLALAYFVWESRFSGDSQLPDQAAQVAQEQIATEKLTEAEATTTAANKSVAVLPFMNMSPDPDQEYFSDGITEEIINALVKVPGLSVPARTSVFAYKGRLQDVREIGRELNVAHVLEGSIRSQGDQVRITAQLINVDTGFHLWSETFDRQLENIFAVQEEIAGSIAGVLVGELGVDVAAVPNQTRDMEAYDLYLQGRAALRNRDDAAIAMFEEVTRKDPGFAPGWAALAMAHNSIVDEDSAAIDAAEKALSIDPDNVDALNAKAAALRGLGRWSEAESQFRKALAIDPSSAELLEDWAEFLNFVGRTDDALEVASRGVAIEPGLLPLQQEYVAGLLSKGKIDEALEAGSKIAESTTWGFYGWYFMLPVWITAIENDRAASIPPKPDLPTNSGLSPGMMDFLALIQVEHLSNPTETWGNQLRSTLERTLEEDGNRRLPWVARFPMVVAGQTEFIMEQYFEENRRQLQETNEWLWTPVLKPVRQHPQFAEFLGTSGLVDYWDASSWPKWCQRDNGGLISCQ